MHSFNITLTYYSMRSVHKSAGTYCSQLLRDPGAQAQVNQDIAKTLATQA